MGRRYTPDDAEEALARLAGAGFAGVNADLMIALPGQTAADVVADLDRAAELGAGQITVYPLFTFPYTAVGEYRRLRRRRDAAPGGAARALPGGHGVGGASRLPARLGLELPPRRRAALLVRHPGRLPRGRAREPGRTSPTGSSSTRSTSRRGRTALARGEPPVALRMPFSGHMAGWWWLYWRFYDTRIPSRSWSAELGGDAAKARRWLRAIEAAGLARRTTARSS